MEKKINRIAQCALFKKEKNITAILDAARKLIKNPIVLLDMSYKLVAHSYNPIQDDRLWNELVSTGRFSHESVSFFKEEGFIESAALGGPIVKMFSDKLKYNRVNCSVYDCNGNKIGNICVVACEKPFEDEDFELIEVLGGIIGEKMPEIDTMNVRRAEDKKIEAFLEGSFADNNFFFETANITSESKLYVGVVDIWKYEDTFTHLEYFCDLFSRLDGRFKYYVYFNNIIILLKFDKPVKNIKSEFSVLNKFFNEYNLYAGVSESFSDIGSLKKYFKQAINALNYGMDSAENDNIFFYDDFKFEFVLKRNLDGGIEDICHPSVLKILKHDALNGTKYITQLYEYLKGCLTAKDGNIVPHEISQMLDLDFSDERTMFSVYLSIKCIKFFSEEVYSYIEKINKGNAK